MSILRIKQVWKVAGFSLTAIVLLCALWFCKVFIISPLDRPWLLSDNEETIEVTYVHWACDCADFVETKKFAHNAVTEPDDDDYIFIEPARAEIKLGDDFYSDKRFYKLRLTGRFYLDKGIPGSYELKTPMKPDHAKVFRYDKIEYVDN